MGRVTILAAAGCLLFCAASCTKEGVRGFEGSWSYKTSGTVSAVEIGSDGTASADTSDFSLVNEQGQMHIVRTSGDNAVLTMNAIGGDAVAHDAAVSGQEISLSGESKNISLERSGQTALRVTVSATGQGVRHGGILVLDMDYSGSFPVGDVTYEIVDSDVRCIASRND